MTFIDITCMSDRSEEVIIETFPRRNDTPFFTTIVNKGGSRRGGLILLAQVWPLRLRWVELSQRVSPVFLVQVRSNEKGNCTHSTIGSSDTNVMGYVQVWIWYSARRVS